MSAPQPKHECIQWDEIAKRLIDSKEPQPAVNVDVKAAARGQLDSAILLWFLDGDPVSIHTLAIAAQELLHKAKTDPGKESPIKAVYASWSKTRKKEWRKPQNFFKHGPDRNDPEHLDYRPARGEIAILDAAGCYIAKYGKETPLMRLFSARFALEMYDGKPVLFRGIAVNDLAHFKRSEFIEKVLTRAGFAELAKRTDSKAD